MTIRAILLFILLSNWLTGHTQLKDALKLTVQSGAYSDETIIRFLEEATDSFDPDWDAYKLSNSGNTPNLSSVINQESYVINALHSPFTEKTVPLKLEVAFAGTYSIIAEELGLFDSLCTIMIRDNLLNSSQNLKDSSNYSFNFSPGDASDRFSITFKLTQPTQDSTVSKQLTSLQNQEANFLSIYSSEGNIFCKIKEPNTIRSIVVCDIYGKEIAESGKLSYSASGYSVIEFNPGSDGIYIVKAETSKDKYFKKIYLSKGLR